MTCAFITTALGQRRIRLLALMAAITLAALALGHEESLVVAAEGFGWTPGPA